MKNLIKTAILSTLLIGGVSHAGGISSGLVSNVVVLPDQQVVFFSANTITNHTNKPACSTQTTGTWAFSTATSGGKVMYAGILTALAAKLPITVEGFGTGVCDAWGDRETARYFYTVN